ncbi:MAG TPA: hypothetical protein VHT96_09115 [Clostridia bacterium]|nr:hypothetical protein [Clostridia bacterium]
MHERFIRWLKFSISMVVLVSLATGTATFAVNAAQPTSGKYVAGDFHTHTYLTDGNKTEAEVVKNAFEKFGLDWMANSEHGGTSAKDPSGNAFAGSGGQFLDANGKKLDYTLWRWITLRDYSYPIVTSLQKQYPKNVLIQGFEWNVPTHEHASVAIVSDSSNAVSDFEYMFDQNDLDTSRSFENLTKSNTTHKDAIAGAKWLETNYKSSSYFLLNHPSRKLKYSVSDIRDLNNAAPDVFFGMEGFPGHQKETARGGYGSFSSDPSDIKNYNMDYYKARTYGGADYMTAKVGGLWDSLLGEGRKFWIFVNSDFHDSADTADFWPGEYAKSYTWVTDNKADAIVNGMRSGNSFAVQGDLINELDFKAGANGKNTAIMGQTLNLNKGGSVKLTIRFKSPSVNNNKDKVQVNHIDLISGNVTGKASPGTAAYSSDTNESAKVIKSFTSKDWKSVSGWNEITWEVKNISNDIYFRLRGTNLSYNVPNETDAQGNPLIDDLVGQNNADKAYADLWFYSNPIFVDAGR